MKKRDLAPLLLLLVSICLMAISIVFKSMLVLAGVTGLVTGWLLCIDKLITAQQLPPTAKVLFAGVAIGLPVFVSIFLG